MTKLIFDLDGVIITYEKNFAEKYSAEFGVDIGKIYEFFANDYYDCAIGRSALREKIEQYVPLWGWQGDADSLIRYWFDCQSTVDSGLLDLIGLARRSGHECYVASDQDTARSAYVRRLVDFDGAFDGAFFSCDLGATKTETVFFERMLGKLGCAPGEAHFWDDNPKNISTARQASMKAEVYTTYDDFRPAFSDRFVSAS
ncbi:HAD hydrolase-like protein [Streptomyces microflavus]|uniref:HAD family hydrolase n=1 Tax=Streptomyces microflavus TaxID=1919 RepID=UPI002256435C|nr:HAD family hydrolase [Streptomyces microflavus]MCX4650913.1 HAD hydrolase-like protein [Streptomyces microflavus]